jgi:hypothetical protein
MPYSIDFNNRQAIKYGSTDIQAVYAGTTKVWPITSVAFYNFNAKWLGAGITGSGTAADPYVCSAKEGLADGMGLNVASAGSLRVTGDVSSDVEYRIQVNGTDVVVKGDYNGWFGALNETVPVAAGASIVFASEYTQYTNFKIWYTP